MLEVDLSDIYGTDYSRDQLSKELLLNPDNRKWIYNPVIDVSLIDAKRQYRIRIEQVRKKLEKERARKAEKRDKGLQKIEQTFTPENYMATISSLRNDRALSKVWQSFHFGIEVSNIPFYMDIPITGEMVFPCDRRIWQSVLFDRFIFNRKEENNPTVHLKRVNSWIKNYNKTFPIDWALCYKTIIPGTTEYRPVSLLNYVVKKYFEYLEYLGFIDKMYYLEADVKSTHSLIPPNKNRSNIFEAILNSIDRDSPRIDSIVSSAIDSGRFEFEDVDPESLNSIDDLFEEGDSSLAENKENIESRKQKEIQKELDEGFEDVKNKDFESQQQIRDRYNKRWCKCVQCKSIVREDGMNSYGGINAINLGICNDCYRQKK